LSQVEKLLEDRQSQYMTDDESENCENEEPQSEAAPAITQTKKRSLSPSKRKSSEPLETEPKILRTSPRLSKSPVKQPSPTKRRSNEEKKQLISDQVENEFVELVAPVQEQIENDIMETDVEVIKEFNTSCNINDNEAVIGEIRSRRVDPIEICQEIFKFKRLANLTYIAPYMQTPEILPEPVLNFVPYFLSLNDLAKEAATRTYMKCKVTAKLFEYSSSACPTIASVFVHCKKCNYVNFTPFHLANIYLSGQLTCILNDITANEKQTQQSQLQTSTQLTNPGTQQQIQELDIDIDEDNSNDLMVKQSINFNLNWLQTAFPASTNQIPFTQAMTQSVTKQNANQESWAYEYECPRCALNNRENADQSSYEYEGSILSYIYRFWFVLRDATSRLDPCLIEGDLALKFLERIEPIKFYTNSAKSHQVYKTIHKNFNKKFLFTLETFNLRKNTVEELTSNTNKNKNVNVLYKIVDMEELVSI
jgi:hypothetical protein